MVALSGLMVLPRTTTDATNYTISARIPLPMPQSDHPHVIRSIAVTTSDVVAALEIQTTSNRDAVLRITPPFNGRMRARLHVAQAGEYTDTPEPIHISPEGLVTADAPSYPQAVDTEDELRADPELSYSVERHHEYHAERVRDWREALPAYIRETVTLETPEGRQTVTVKPLVGDL